MEFLRENIFYNKFNEVDTRQPLFQAGRIGVTGIITIDPLFLTQLIVVCTLTQAMCFSVAAAAYYGIVVPRKHRQEQQDQGKIPPHKKTSSRSPPQETIQAILFGYGVLLPILLYFPYWLIESLRVQNCMLLLSVVGCPVLSVMRLIETLHASRMPTFTQTKVWWFCLYFALPMVLDHNDQEPVKATAAQTRQKIIRTLSVYLRASLLLSFLAAYDFELFPSRKPIQNVWDLIYWGNLGNNYVAASVVSLTLDASCAFGELALSLLTGGLHFVNSHEAPMTASTSVSNFWSQRWNRVVGDSLKRGVFGPLRRVLSRSVAAILTFLMSGLAHEYMLFILSAARVAGGKRYGVAVVANNLLREPYQHQLGNQFGFFVYNGFLLILEELWRERPALVWMQKNIPRPIRTFLIMFLVVPVTHLFTDEYDRCGIFRDVSMGFPRLTYDMNRVPLIKSELINSTATILQSSPKPALAVVEYAQWSGEINPWGSFGSVFYIASKKNWID